MSDDEQFFNSLWEGKQEKPKRTVPERKAQQQQLVQQPQQQQLQHQESPIPMEATSVRKSRSRSPVPKEGEPLSKDRRCEGTDTAAQKDPEVQQSG